MKFNLSTIGFITWIIFMFVGLVYMIKTGDFSVMFFNVIFGWLIPVLGIAMDEYNKKGF